MHEFLLFAQAPARRHEQILNIFAGITASQPTAYQEQHLIFAPLKVTEQSVNAKRKAQVNLNQQRVFHNVYRDTAANASEDEPPKLWKVRVNETPEPGVQQMISRSTSEFQLQEDHQQQYLNNSTFRYLGQQTYSGHRFVHGHTLIKIFQVLLPKAPQEQPFECSAPSLEQLQLLDPSGAYLIEASVRMEDRTNSKLTEVANKELLDLKKLLQGAIELYAPDRLALDTRVRDG